MTTPLDQQPATDQPGFSAWRLIWSPLLLWLPMMASKAGAAADAQDGATVASMAALNLVIVVFVCAVAGNVAYLCYCAVRLWSGTWRGLALAPLIILGAWMGVIFIAMFAGNTRSYWTAEILFWAMSTTVYLVILFTARRAFEKAEGEKYRD